MVQNASWEWLLEGFKIDLETQVKPRTIEDYCYHISYFARWTKDSNILDPHSITKRDIQEFLHFIASTPAIFFTGNGAKRCIQRNENSRWHHYFPFYILKQVNVQCETKRIIKKDGMPLARLQLRLTTRGR